MFENRKVVVVIPCFKVANQIGNVLAKIPDFVDAIICIDDACPEFSGRYIQSKFDDSRICVLFNKVNLGVGGAVITGYIHSVEIYADIVVKVDGDDQMDLALLPEFLAPIARGHVDYTKGNRFHWIDSLQEMPLIRLIGNSGLSFINKMASGYWDLMDPTNGYTAINAKVLGHIPLEKIERRYFFESDMLFRLGIIRAVVMDIPMKSKYGTEISNLSPLRSLISFPPKYVERLLKRFVYLYLIRDFNAGSLFCVLGIPCLLFGTFFGFYKWYAYSAAGLPTPVGTLFLIALSLIFAFQFLLAFLIIDVQNSPSRRK